jgi:predicted transport protein
MKTTQYYFAYRRIKNFTCVEVHPQTGQLLVFLKVNPDEVELEEGSHVMSERSVTSEQAIWKSGSTPSTTLSERSR